MSTGSKAVAIPEQQENQLMEFPIPNQSGKVRVIIKDGKPWYFAKDVCDMIGIKNSRDAVSHLENNEKADVGSTDTSSNGVIQRRKHQIVSRPGLTKLAIQSRKPAAAPLVDWLAHDVVESIFETGQYSIQQTKVKIPTPDQALIEYGKTLIKLGKERQKTKALEAKIKQDKPLVDFSKMFVPKKQAICREEMGDIMYSFGKDTDSRNKLINALVSHDLLIKENGTYIATEKAIEQNLLINEKKIRRNSKGKIISTSYKTYITRKGQQWIFDNLS